MSEHMFGLGPGWLPHVTANAIAEKHGAHLVNYTDAQCRCGMGCRMHTCRKSRRHWFACRNRGAPFDAQTAKAVLDDLKEAGLI